MTLRLPALSGVEGLRPIGISSWCLAFLITALCAALAGSVRAAAQEVGTEAQRESGKKLYLKNCSQCHGENGDGEGYAAPHLRPRPRNFTTGKFKVRTTPNGALPTHQDLVNIIRRGMPYLLRPGSVGSRLLPDDLFPRLLEARECPQAR
jgi:TRAP-type C4-dicarboxylate transport system substrate-binding protein